MVRSASVGVAVLMLACNAAAQDFHFVSSRDSGPTELNFEVYRYVNGTETRVTFTPVIEEHPVFSPSNNLTIFSAPSPMGQDVVTVTGPGAAPTPIPILPLPGELGFSHPFLAPDELSLFITVEMDDDTTRLRRVDLSGADLGVVVDHNAETGHSPTASTPDGDKLYYTSDHDGDFEIYRSNLDGTNEQQLTHTSVYEGGVTVSGNGLKIAYARQDPTDQCTTQIFVADHDGANEMLVTNPFVSGTKWPFTWDGNSIIYVSDENGDSQIFKIDANGSGKTLLVNSPGADQHLLPDALCGTPGPDLELMANPPLASVGAPVTFSADTGGKSYNSYQWTFGDGGTGTTAAPDTTHTYNQSGTYYVTVTAVDVCSPSGDRIADGFVEIVVPQFPGTGEDLILWTGVNAPPDPVEFKPAFPNDILDVLVDSPGGTWHFSPYLVVAQLFDPATPPNMVITGLHPDPFDPDFFILVDTFTPPPPSSVLIPPPLLPGGNSHAFLVPPSPSLSGMDLMLQALVLDPTAQNGVFAGSGAKVIQFQ